ncbi:MAG: hypothetical protein ACE37K_15195 [Planctomycetota bacterium]
MRCASVVVALLLAGSLGAQIRAPASAPAGAAIVVDVGPGAMRVCYAVEGSRHVRWRLVAPNGRVTLEVPAAPSGSVLRIWIGRGDRRTTCRVVVQ